MFLVLINEIIWFIYGKYRGLLMKLLYFCRLRIYIFDIFDAFILAVRDEGIPQPFEQLCSHMRKLTRTSEHIKPQDWLKHLNELRSLSVLANQATEFVYNKNRTEGKTGIIKPDLIPTNLRGTAITSVASSTEAHSSSSSTSTASVAKDNVTDKSIKIEHKAKVKQQKVSEKNGEEDCEKAKKNEIHIEDDEKTIQVQKQAKFVDRIPNKSSVHSSSTRKPEASVAAVKKTALNFPIVKTTTIQPERSQEMSEKSPNKKVLKAKPTEIKKIEPIKILSKVGILSSYNLHKVVVFLDLITILGNSNSFK